VAAYANRTITFKDGKVISDVAKKTVSAATPSVGASS
jgi:ABC-type uncharacterized transport system ATPase component